MNIQQLKIKVSSCKAAVNTRLKIQYAKKYHTNLIKAIFESKIVRENPLSILSEVSTNNIGIGDFFYSLDHTFVIKTSNFVIDNIPVDYGYVINHKIGDTEVEKIVKDLVDKINDPRVKLDTPSSLKEALQLILFWNSLLWQTGHKLVGLGRLDKVLDSFKIPENAEKLICDFLMTLHCEYEFKSSSLKGDTGQIILLGGLEEDGSYFCNEYTELFIKCLNKLNLPDPKILLRCSENMSEDLLKMAVDCASTGIGSPLFSNDEIVIPNLIDFGYERKDAYNYGVSACWEPLSIGNSLEQNNLAHIEFGRCINEAILDCQFIKSKNIDDVIKIFFEKVENNCSHIKHSLDQYRWQEDPLLTFMMGLDKDISHGSAKYNNYGILSVGMSSAVNSLLNIQKYVFEEKKYTLIDIQNIILRNYQSDSDAEIFSLNEHGYGTDNVNAIDITNAIIDYTEKVFKDYRNIYGGKVKFGLSSPVYIDFGKMIGATLDGRKAGEPFQTHISRDKGEPITEIMNFESKLEFSGFSCNANVIDIMVQSSLIRDNIDKFTAYIMGGIKEGIFQLQMNVLSYAQLVDAKEHPEKYPNLIVRVWGFSAYFNDLPEEYKDNLIRRAKEMERIA